MPIWAFCLFNGGAHLGTSLIDEVAIGASCLVKGGSVGQPGCLFGCLSLIYGAWFFPNHFFDPVVFNKVIHGGFVVCCGHVVHSGHMINKLFNVRCLDS